MKLGVSCNHNQMVQVCRFLYVPENPGTKLSLSFFLSEIFNIVLTLAQERAVVSELCLVGTR